MVVLDEKTVLPPPYSSMQQYRSNNPFNRLNPLSPSNTGSNAGLPPFPRPPGPLATLISLPQHLLLKILYMSFPMDAGPHRDVSTVERQRKTLWWMETQLRRVNRAFYVACMHILRSTFLPAYDTLIRPPYTSDPFPLTGSSSSSRPAGSTTTMPSYTPTPAHTSPYGERPSSSAARRRDMVIGGPLQQRETAVLDLFIALKIREDVFLDDTELHNERDESFRDLFELMQPRARLEDLVRIYGVREGVVSAGDESPSSSRRSLSAAKPSSSRPVLQQQQTPQLAQKASPSSSGGSSFASRFKVWSSKKEAPKPAAPPPRPAPPPPLPFDRLSVTLQPRKAGLVMSSPSAARSRQTLVEVERSRSEKLEIIAKRLVRALKEDREEDC
ncbi:hypothetical protein CONPUDRAFT_85596 [Coniophora puteana RWD-64-598 SS2]|uniref:F-box domain-containing protein n=1 Tax=Coniophora puteana (strain RWD-64-598) TaxID=741705 RepID=A0A5M3M6V4_CONPW|nr:uncharacterized protein CONPUDRAFT_85596 [Coniophora puteana RWD-64-598 SS2]EIW74793.1 hypothetical protein CONPUDRAFT_85596 [Coniophora puteana RWD-64-598 SS2]